MSRISALLRLCPRASIHSMIGLKVPTKTSATTRRSTTIQSRQSSQKPARAAPIHRIVRGASSKRTALRLGAGGMP